MKTVNLVLKNLVNEINDCKTINVGGVKASGELLVTGCNNKSDIVYLRIYTHDIFNDYEDEVVIVNKHATIYEIFKIFNIRVELTIILSTEIYYTVNELKKMIEIVKKYLKEELKR